MAEHTVIDLNSFKMATLLTILSYAASEDMHVHHLEVNSSFLNAPIWDDVYVKSPWYVQIEKSLLHGHPKPEKGMNWYHMLQNTLQKLKWKASQNEPFLFLRGSDFLLVDVGGFVVCARNEESVYF